MKRLLISAVLGCVALVGTDLSVYDGGIDLTADGEIQKVKTDAMYRGTIESDALFTFNPEPPCTHDKLKAVSAGWPMSIVHEGCPTEYNNRMYVCKKCGARIFIQQALELPSLTK